MHLQETSKAIRNFPFPDIMQKSFLQAILIIKKHAANANLLLKKLSKEEHQDILSVTDDLIKNFDLSLFPLSIYQTGSGTSSNMNINEVISSKTKLQLHPNDKINLSQSSNDVIPTAIRISCVLEVENSLFPVLDYLKNELSKKIELSHLLIKSGKTHLMNATPISFAQVFSGYKYQVELFEERLRSCLIRLKELPQGGTAVGTGINTHKEFASHFIASLNTSLKQNFTETKNHFEAQSMLNAPLELSSCLKDFCTSLIKILTDLRLMNSDGGFKEITLTPLQAGSSIMPGKVNPVLEEALTMMCLQIIGFDTANTMANALGNFELNTFLPLVGQNLLKSLELLSLGLHKWIKLSFSTLTILESSIKAKLENNPIILTALNPLLGYEKVASIIKKAEKENRRFKDILLEETNLTEKDLEELLNPTKLIYP
jgi:fumarate hydratase class II